MPWFRLVLLGLSSNPRRMRRLVDRSRFGGDRLGGDRLAATNSAAARQAASSRTSCPGAGGVRGGAKFMAGAPVLSSHPLRVSVTIESSRTGVRLALRPGLIQLILYALTITSMSVGPSVLASALSNARRSPRRCRRVRPSGQSHGRCRDVHRRIVEIHADRLVVAVDSFRRFLRIW